MSEIYVTSEELRDIILGKITYRKCPCCDSNGTEYWDIDGEVVLPYAHPDWEDYNQGECENCDGVGYIQNAY